MVCDAVSGLRRSGGQGDLLAGSLATFLAWQSDAFKEWPKDSVLAFACCQAACRFIRSVSHVAFTHHGRSTSVTHMIPEMGSVFTELFENKK